MYLTCNNIKCRSTIQKFMTITPCSHVYCESCLTKIENLLVCIACKNILERDELLIRDLNNITNMFGYAPDDVLECARDAISFWMFQIHQQNYIKENLYERAENEAQKKIDELKVVRLKAKVEKESMKNEIAKLENSLKKEKRKFV